MDTWFGPNAWFLPDDKILTDCTNKIYCQNLLDNLNHLGFNSCYMSRTLGSAFIILLGGLLLLFVIILPSKLLTCNVWIKKFNKYLEDKFLWGFYIELIAAPILLYAIGGYMNIKYCPITSNSSPAEIVNFSISVILFPIVLIYPIANPIFTCLNFKRLKNEEF